MLQQDNCNLQQQLEGHKNDLSSSNQTIKILHEESDVLKDKLSKLREECELVRNSDAASYLPFSGIQGPFAVEEI